MPPGPHRTVTLSAPWGERVAVDCGIAELVAACWEAGVRTLQSCEDFGGGYVWLAFDSLAALRAFLHAAVPLPEGDNDTDDLWGRVTAHDVLSPDSTPERDGQWRYRLLPSANTPAVAGPGFRVQWTFGVSVEFPTGDVGKLTRNLAAAG